MDADGVEVAPEEQIYSSRSSSGCDSEKWETSEDEGRGTKSKRKVLPEGFLDPLPPQKPFKLPRLSGVGLHANKVICCGSSSRGESSGSSNDPSTPMHLDSIEDSQFIESQQPSRQSFQEFPRQAPPPNDGIRLIDEQGTPIRRRGQTTCTDIKCMPLGTRVHIEVNENGVPCNIPESILLGSYMGVVARDSILAPISFSDWRNKGMEPFKKRMLAEVESKFEFHASIRHWILQSIGVKWRNYKASLKSEHWDSRPIKEIKETVPGGVDPTQWCQLVNQWAQPEDQKRAARNVKNAKKQTCPHTMGRVSSVRRQQETSIQDRLQLWRINRMRKDGLWSSEDAKLRWVILANFRKG
ncbi:uncharacterized protein LOC110102589 isoform X2 [Dendrobium catenatum]|uniref:uncharacterized protein LOC110102589 isoform X2 n=1 Tax=Dendrobium catenatum TaxID=906689 RepID=UPI00109EFA21|nr:uncharacterized protein LOC110102589 isoform X2 [Dendrobium catenatum]